METNTITKQNQAATESTTFVRGKLSIFERAKNRLFGSNSTRSEGSEGPAAAVTRVAAEIKREDAQPKPSAAKRPASPKPETYTGFIGRDEVESLVSRSPRNLGEIGKHAIESTEQLAALITRPAKLSSKDLDRYKAEMAARGFILREIPPKSKMDEPRIRIGLTMQHFENLPHGERNAIMRNGGEIIAIGSKPNHSVFTGRKFDETPAEFSAKRKITYPIQPPPGPTWKQFMGYSPEKKKAYIEKVSNREAGRIERIHLYDAWASTWPSSWRYDGATSDSQKRFHEMWRDGINACIANGVQSESPNDPAPPIVSPSMTAADYLSLPPLAVDKLCTLMAGEDVGRVARCELKRACELASPGMQTALLADRWAAFLIGPTSFPAEWIWPVGYEREA